MNDAPALPVADQRLVSFSCLPRTLVRYDAQIDRREGRGHVGPASEFVGADGYIDSDHTGVAGGRVGRQLIIVAGRVDEEGGLASGPAPS